MYSFLNQFSGKKWWLAVEILGWLVVAISFAMALPCIDMFYDATNSFGAANVVGETFSKDNPLRVVVFGRWVVSDKDSAWIMLVALFSLTFGGRTGLLLMIWGDHYRRGLVFRRFKPWNILIAGRWVDPAKQG